MGNEKQTILSLNIERGYLLDELKGYIDNKKAEVDIFCFQEISLDVLNVFMAVLGGGFKHHFVSKETERPGHFYNNAIVYRTEYELEQIDSIWSQSVDLGLATAYSLRSSDGDLLTVVNVHGTPRPGHKLDTPARLEQSKSIVDSLEYMSHLVVVVGDFNLMPQTDSVGTFSDDGYVDLIDEFNIPTTRNELSWSRYPDSKQLYADYAFIKNVGRFEYDFTVEDIVVSDHLPLIISLTSKL